MFFSNTQESCQATWPQGGAEDITYTDCWSFNVDSQLYRCQLPINQIVAFNLRIPLARALRSIHLCNLRSHIPMVFQFLLFLSHSAFSSQGVDSVLLYNLLLPL